MKIVTSVSISVREIQTLALRILNEPEMSCILIVTVTCEEQSIGNSA